MVDRDRALVEAAQRGDQSAFVDLVRSTGDRFFALAYRMLRDADRAEDALQDALVIAWRDLRRSAIRTVSTHGCTGVVTNVCIANATHERRRTANLRLLPVEGPAGRDEFVSLGDRDQLERAFRRLTPEERGVLVLHHYAGYSRPRSPRPLVSRPARSGPDYTMRTGPCEQLSTLKRGR